MNSLCKVLPHTAHISVQKLRKILLTLLFLRLHLISCHCKESKSVRLPSVQTEPSQPGWGPGLHSSEQHVSIFRSGSDFCVWRLQKTVRNGLQQCECVCTIQDMLVPIWYNFFPSILSWFSGMRKFGTNPSGWECSCLQLDDRDIWFPYRILEFPCLKSRKEATKTWLHLQMFDSLVNGEKITFAHQQNNASH